MKALLLFHVNNLGESPDGSFGEQVAKMASDLLADGTSCSELVDVLGNFSVTTEFERLNNPRTNGLGGEKHQQVVGIRKQPSTSTIARAFSFVS